jgi:GNAT superfamily N-acetyltransferase
MAPETIDAVSLEPAIAAAINRLMVATWPHIANAKEGTIDFLLERWTHYDGDEQHRPLYHLAQREGALLGLAHTFPRTIASAQGEMVVMGLANVCVAQTHRAQGLGRLIVESAFDRVRTAGWERLRSTIVFTIRSPRIQRQMRFGIR